jgi:ribonuclease Y
MLPVDGLETMILALSEGWLPGAFLIGSVLTFFALRFLDARANGKRATMAQSILEEARRNRDSILSESKEQAEIESKQLTSEATRRINVKDEALAERESILSKREGLVNDQLESLVKQEGDLRESRQSLTSRTTELENERQTLEDLQQEAQRQLEKTSAMSAEEAKVKLLDNVSQTSEREALELERRILDIAKAQAEAKANRIISLAIQRYAGEQTFESTTATVGLNGDDLKGRIIGKEGRNIRAFEAATGVTVLIDDTPNAVVLSGFDPVRREIAREAMSRLIQDGRIHPTRIEEVVTKSTQEISEHIYQTAEEAVYKLKIAPLHSEILQVLGKLRFRHSYSQNVLDHSLEVAELMGLIAAELGLNIEIAKRTGLLHDIGKALGHDAEGPHAIVGAQFLKKHGEGEEVVDGVASHHDETPESSIYGILAGAADAISAARPGARSETMATYLKRLKNLEEIGLSFTGVDKCFAVHAGRELRILVQPEKLDDLQSQVLARRISRKIEEELQYPGQIRVTVVRERRCIEFAR